MAIEKIKIMGAVLELPAKQRNMFWPKLASKTAPRILIVSIVQGAKYPFYVKFIATYAPILLGFNNSKAM